MTRTELLKTAKPINVCNKHAMGASAIGLALLRLMELNERVKELEDALIKKENRNG